MVWHGSTYIVPQDRSFRGTLYFFGQVDSVPRGLAVWVWDENGSTLYFKYIQQGVIAVRIMGLGHKW